MPLGFSLDAAASPSLSPGSARWIAFTFGFGLVYYLLVEKEATGPTEEKGSHRARKMSRLAERKPSRGRCSARCCGPQDCSGGRGRCRWGPGSKQLRRIAPRPTPSPVSGVAQQRIRVCAAAMSTNMKRPLLPNVVHFRPPIVSPVQPDQGCAVFCSPDGRIVALPAGTTARVPTSSRPSPSRSAMSLAPSRPPQLLPDSSSRSSTGHGWCRLGGAMGKHQRGR